MVMNQQSTEGEWREGLTAVLVDATWKPEVAGTRQIHRREAAAVAAGKLRFRRGGGWWLRAVRAVGVDEADGSPGHPLGARGGGGLRRRRRRALGGSANDETERGKGA